MGTWMSGGHATGLRISQKTACASVLYVIPQVSSSYARHLVKLDGRHMFAFTPSSASLHEYSRESPAAPGAAG